MSLRTNLENLSTRIATEVKTLRTLLNGNAVDNSALTTTAKSNLVLAINEVKTIADAGANTLDELTDVAVTSPAAGHVLRHNGTEFVNTLAAAVAFSGSATDITTGTLPTSVLPPLAINDVSTVANEAAMLALTAQRGDIAIRQDNGRSYVLSTDDPTLAVNWKEVMAAGQVLSVNGQTGVVVLDVYTKSEIGDPETNFVAVFEAGLV